MVRAAAAVKRHAMVAWASLRWRSRASTSRRSVASSGMRLPRHWRLSTLSSISAMFRPTAMLWGVVELQALQYPPCLHRGKGLVQRCRPVGIEVVQHDPNPLRLGVGFVHQPPHLVGKVLHPPLLGDRHMPPTPQGLAEHEQIARAVASVLIVKPLSPSPMGWNRYAALGDQLGGGLIKTRLWAAGDRRAHHKGPIHPP